MKDVMFTLLLLFISHVAPIVSASGGIPSEAATWDEKMSPVKKKKKKQRAESQFAGELSASPEEGRKKWLRRTDGWTGSGFIGLWRCFLALRRVDALQADKKGSARADPGGRDTECSPQCCAALSASVAARRTAGGGTERWRSLGGWGNKKEIPLLLCEPGALRRLIQSQCSVQGRLRVSWV